MTEQQLKALGFKMTKQYEHDQYITKRYTKGVLEVEFTYGWEGLITIDLSIKEVICKPVTLKEIKALTPILGN